MNKVQWEKLNRITNNERVVCSDEDLDAIDVYRNSREDIYKQLEWLVSDINPNQCGILDRYVAYILPNKYRP